VFRFVGDQNSRAAIGIIGIFNNIENHHIGQCDILIGI